MLYLPTMMRSFYDPAVYVQYRYQRKGYGLQYALVLLLVTFLVSALVVLPDLRQVHKEIFVGEAGKLSIMDDVFRQVADQIPVMTYQNHTLQTREPGKHVIQLQVNVNGEVIKGRAITIDTSGKSSHATMETPVLFTAHEVISKNEGKIEIRTYKELDNDNSHMQAPLQIDGSIAREMAAAISPWIKGKLVLFYGIVAAFVLPILFGVFYIGRIILLMALALGGLVLGSMLSTKVEWMTALRMASLSFTPVAFLSVASLFLVGRSPGVYTLLVCGLVMLAAALFVSKEAPAA